MNTRICIIGYSGSGKSTLAIELGEIYDIPVLHLDNVAVYGDWIPRSLEERNELVNKFIDENENWIIDGNYYNVAHERFELCNQIIFMDFNRFFCFKEAYKRYKKNKNQIRESCPCIEKFDLEFQKWILLEGRTKKIVSSHQNHMKQYGKNNLHFKNRKEVNDYLDKIKGNG